MDNIDMDLFRYKLRKRCKELKITHKELAKNAGISESSIDKWLNGKPDTYNPQNKDYIPSLNTVYKVSQVLGVSLDYFVNPNMDCLTVTNQAIKDMIGIDDKGIQGLKNIKLSDDNAIHNEQPGLCVLPVLNDMLGSGYDFEQLLNAFRDFLHTDYCVPVYHTGKGIKRNSKQYGKILDNETVSSSSDMDIIKGHTLKYKENGKVKTATFPNVYLQHFARENDLYDNKAIVITKEFLQAVALKEIEQAAMQIKESLESKQ